MKAIILAAGRGTRMGNLTLNSHKCLSKIHGMQLIEIQINSLLESGVKDIALVTGYNSSLVKKKEIKKYFHNKIWNKSNMIYSLFMADEWLSSEKCIVSYSDIFYSPNAIKSLKKSKGVLSITYDPNWLKLWSRRFSDPLSDAESFQINSKNEVVKIGSKEKNSENIMGQYMGLISFTPTGWKYFKKIWDNERRDKKLNLSITEILQRITFNGNPKITGISYEDIWGEVDRESDIILYEKLFNKNNPIFNKNI